jgi:hypothetical protein
LATLPALIRVPQGPSLAAAQRGRRAAGSADRPVRRRRHTATEHARVAVRPRSTRGTAHQGAAGHGQRRRPGDRRRRFSDRMGGKSGGGPFRPADAPCTAARAARPRRQALRRQTCRAGAVTCPARAGATVPVVVGRRARAMGRMCADHISRRRCWSGGRRRHCRGGGGPHANPCAQGHGRAEPAGHGGIPRCGLAVHHRPDWLDRAAVARRALALEAKRSGLCRSAASG